MPNGEAAIWDDTDPVIAQAARYPTAVVPRVGHLVERMSKAVEASICLESLHALVDGAQVVDLYPQAARIGDRDDRWNVIANIEIEPDL